MRDSDNVFPFRANRQDITRELNIGNSRVNEPRLIPPIGPGPYKVSEYANIYSTEVNTAQVKVSGESAMSDVTREEVESRIETSEARTELKIVRLEGKLDLVLSRLDTIREDNRTMRESAREDNRIILESVRQDGRATKANIWVIGIGLAVLIVSMVALFPVFFGLGTQVRDIIDSSVHSHLQSK
jgi:hypothetical protein